MKKSLIFNTIIGNIQIIEDSDYIVGINFSNDKKDINTLEKPTLLMKETKSQIIEYLSGSRKSFDIPLKYEGTLFQRRVWEALLTIPYGKTISYQDIANQIGNPKAIRAVGMACHNNPIPIIIPCHRVIGKNGKLVGFGGGLNIKEILLKIERG